MTEVQFYHLTRSSLEQVLPDLLEKTLMRGMKAVVMTGSPERAEALTQHLWTYNSAKFLPHGNQKDGNAEMQPIWLTSLDERPNAAKFLFLIDGAQSHKLKEYERVCEIFDGTNEEAVATARLRWSEYKGQGFALTYWQQGERGWAKIDA